MAKRLFCGHQGGVRFRMSGRTPPQALPFIHNFSYWKKLIEFCTDNTKAVTAAS